MKLLYDFLTCVIAYLLYPILFFHARGKRRLSERYGSWEDIPTEEVYWFHGASMGEVKGLLPIIRVLKSHQPEARVMLTATSPTGLDVASDEVDLCYLLPFDHPLFFKRILSKIHVRAFIFGETELWPNILQSLSDKGVPLHLVNGVIADKSFYWYKKLKSLFRPALLKLQSLSVSDEKSFHRFLELGAEKDRIQVTGNAKHDRLRKIENDQAASELKKRFFKDDSYVLTLGSMHPGEIVFWFKALKEALTDLKQLAVLIAPRHREKFAFFEEELKRYSIPYFLRTKMSTKGSASVCLLDTYGELEDAYSFSDAAFVGGTFVEIGGHNPFEPASYGVLPIVGPYIHKIQPLIDELVEDDACTQLSDENEVKKFVSEFVQEVSTIRNRGGRAQEVFRKHQGASLRIYQRAVGG